MDFDTFIDQAWTDHANDAAAVAQRMDATALSLVTDESQGLRLAHLAHHVLGEHLARWQDGLQFLQALAAGQVIAPGGDTAMALRRYQASLRLAGGLADERAAFTASERIRITALAAGNLGGHDAVRASALLHDAVAQADAAALADKDPAHRVLAIAGNGIAGTLEEHTDRSAEQTALMLHAAKVARQYWGLAGTWLETERAEYRLAMSWCQAGDFVRARQHAQHCLEIVGAHGSLPLEVFFGWEALGTVERAAGNAAGHQQALAQAQTAFDKLDDGDRGWCQASLDKLQRPTAASPQP